MSFLSRFVSTDETKTLSGATSSNANASRGCPLANLDIAPTSITPGQCPFHAHQTPSQYEMKQPVPLAKRGNTHKPSQGQSSLLKDIGGGDRVREFTTRFYSHAFLDDTLKQFFFMNDGPEAHGKRLGSYDHTSTYIVSYLLS